QVSQHVHGIADNDQIRVLFQACRLHLIENAQEKIDIAINQIKPAFVGLATQAGSNHDDVATRHFLKVSSADALVGHQAGAVQEVGGLAKCQFFFGVDQNIAAEEATALMFEGGVGHNNHVVADDA